jgi:hypothetical protein
MREIHEEQLPSGINAVDLRYVGQAFQPAFRELAGWKACPTYHPTTSSQQHYHPVWGSGGEEADD